MFWLIIIIASWGFVHSLLASMGLKNLVRRTLGDGFMKFYTNALAWPKIS